MHVDDRCRTGRSTCRGERQSTANRSTVNPGDFSTGTIVITGQNFTDDTTVEINVPPEEVPSDRRRQIIVEGGLRAFLNDQLRGSALVG